MFKEFVFPAWVRMAGGRRRRRRTRQNTDRGRLLQTGMIICAALGIDTDLNLIYQLFALLLCLVLISRASLYAARPEINVRRRLPRYATAGEPFVYYIDVSNEGTHVEKDLRVVDNPVNQVPTLAEFRSHREPGEETRNAYDRWIGFHRFMWLMRIKTGITTQAADLPDIGLRGRVPAAIEATPLRRGMVSFRATEVLHPDLMGLAYGVISFDNPEQLTVLPKRYPISRQFRLPGGRHFQPGGVNSTWSIGESDEFVSLRDYREGDSLRKIHWASSARRNKPVVKEYQEEYLVRQALVLEAETDDPVVLEGAISLAASLILNESNSDSMLDLVYFSEGHPQIMSSGRGASSVNRQLEALACMEPSTGSLTRLGEVTARHAEELSGVILILTGWDDQRAELVEKVRHSGVAFESLVVERGVVKRGSAPVPAGIRVLDADHMSDEVARL